jgi:hypothetical protein
MGKKGKTLKEMRFAIVGLAGRQNCHLQAAA